MTALLTKLATKPAPESILPLLVVTFVVTEERVPMSESVVLKFFGAMASVVVTSLMLTACTNSSSNPYVMSGEFESAMSPDSNEITYEGYRDRKILLVIPPGNRNPALSWATLNSRENMPEKTYEKFKDFDEAGLKADLDRRFRETLARIGNDPQTVAEIRKAGKLYGIDPALILGNIIGEHIYNTQLVMLAQDKVMESTISTWATKWALRFSASGISLADLLKEAPFGVCQSKATQSDFWECASEVYEKSYRGRTVNGRSFGSKSLKYTFFNPIASGLTYGLGQLDPIRALMVTDRVNKISGFPYLTVEDPTAIYEAILNPRSAVHYVAANIVVSLEIYRKYASFDISQNIGVVATLYNLGKEKQFASNRYRETLQALKRGEELKVPVESYYGFIINEKESEIRRFLQ